MRLINADKLKKDVLDLPNCYNGFSDTYDKALILDLVDEQPTVNSNPYKSFEQYAEKRDFVEVVRCKDCKWWKTNYVWDGNERKICAREAYEPFRKAEDFCSRGERKCRD